MLKLVIACILGIILIPLWLPCRLAGIVLHILWESFEEGWEYL